MIDKKKPEESKKESNPEKIIIPKQENGVNLGLNYTINLVLPKTDDPAIFDAIFKSLKDNLLDG